MTQRVPETHMTPALRELTNLQHLYPHQPLLETTKAVCQRLGNPAHVGERAVHSLELHPGLAIGRLVREQIIHLARQIETLTTHPARPATEAA